MDNQATSFFKDTWAHEQCWKPKENFNRTFIPAQVPAHSEGAHNESRGLEADFNNSLNQLPPRTGRMVTISILADTAQWRVRTMLLLFYSHSVPGTELAGDLESF
ncbi:hypothetical protein AAFF_G00000670 [Aldrovandia affinis]|uniref:Uncharacterized protein n=1 Tax=Aldrovandia affinis TaxID=143900 RepID=A0AAD7TD39_9TELE|nr:hypothetical protein AAFF_G00000670 [Aldrovandia affinis]